MKNGRSALVACLASLALGAATAGCSDEIECGPGTRAEGDRCVAVCAPGAEVDPETGACVATCVEGAHRDPASGACLPDSSACVSGALWDPEAARCVPVDSLCSSATTWVASESRCVPNAELRAADHTEGTGENDPTWGGPEAFEHFALPAVGGRVTLTGTVDLPVDRNDDGWADPDWDLWVFEVDEPALLRVSADGLGGSTSGFQIMSVDDGEPVQRFGIGTTDAGVTRDLLLPRSGLYALVASDALNFVSGGPGPYHGGGSFGYYISLERRPLPEPTPVQLTQGYLEINGTIPKAPPADGSTVAFYSLTLPARTSYVFNIRSRVVGTLPYLGVLTEAGFVFGDAYPYANGLLEDTPVSLVVDCIWFFATADADYRAQIIEQNVTFFDGSLSEVSLFQSFWNTQLKLQSHPFGFEAGEHEIVTVRTGSSTGATCFNLYDRTQRWLVGKHGCTPGESAPTGQMRLFAPSRGIYMLDTTDWSGGKLSNGYLYEIPAHEYSVSVDIARQVPRAVGAVDAPWTASGEQVDALTPERFYLLDPGPGAQGFWAEASGAIDAEISLYTLGLKPLVADAAARDGGLALRSPNGKPVVVGVRDLTGGEATYDLRLEPLPVVELGELRPGGVLERTETLPAGGTRLIVHVGSERNGLLVATASAPGLDLAMVPRDVFLGPLGTIDAAGAGEAETAARALNFQGAYFEVVTADGAPVAADTPVSLRAALRPSTLESELNGSTDEAQEINPPIALAGSLRGVGDVDVFRVRTTEPVTLLVEVLPTGDVYDLYMSRLEVTDASGRSLGVDHESGQASLARLVVQLPEPGVFHVTLHAYGRSGLYLLEATTQPL